VPLAVFSDAAPVIVSWTPPAIPVAVGMYLHFETFPQRKIPAIFQSAVQRRASDPERQYQLEVEHEPAGGRKISAIPQSTVHGGASDPERRYRLEVMHKPAGGLEKSQPPEESFQVAPDNG